MGVIATVAVASFAYDVYSTEKSNKKQKKLMNSAQGALIGMFDSWGGEDGVQMALKASEQHLLDAGTETREGYWKGEQGFIKADKIVGETRKKQLAIVAETQRQVEIAAERTIEAASAVAVQRGGSLGMISTAGDAALRGATYDVASQANKANVSLGNLKSNIEGGAGTALSSSALGKGKLGVAQGAAQSMILGQMANREMKIASTLTELEKARANMVAGFANQAGSSGGGGLDLSGIGDFLGFMGGDGGVSNKAASAGMGASMNVGANVAKSFLGF